MKGAEVLVTAQASAFPPAVSQAALWEGFFASRFPSRVAARAFSVSGVERRHAAVNPLVEDIADWPTSRRMTRFVAEAMPLAKEAVTGALERAALAADEIGLLVVATCTGYATPGIDIGVARDLGMDAGLKRVAIGHVGCHAALPALDVARDFCRAEHARAVVLCIELPSLHLQPPRDDPEQAVVHALFSDGAAALVVEEGAADRHGLVVHDLLARSDTSVAGYLGWEVGDHGFEMALSSRVPLVLAAQVEPLVDKLLLRNGTRREQVAGWAIHPGGPRIVETIGERLGLAPADLAASRQVLAEHGNCSSPTVLVVLEELARVHAPGDLLVALTFGPGLTLYGALLEVR